MAELRAVAKYPLVVHPFSVPGNTAQEIMNTFSDQAKLPIFARHCTEFAMILCPLTFGIHI